MKPSTVFGFGVCHMASLATAGSFRRAVDTEGFQLYGYGAGVGGLTLFYAGGNAYIGDYTRINNPDAAPVIFTASQGYLLGSPNATVSPALTTYQPGRELPLLYQRPHPPHVPLCSAIRPPATPPSSLTHSPPTALIFLFLEIMAVWNLFGIQCHLISEVFMHSNGIPQEGMTTQRFLSH
uniref:Uncharacterized protein n=1 Tax=Bionectria ochroleuca TaxID=29856 RepID=A0A8H7K282_BIOOC